MWGHRSLILRSSFGVSVSKVWEDWEDWEGWEEWAEGIFIFCTREVSKCKRKMGYKYLCLLHLR